MSLSTEHSAQDKIQIRKNRKVILAIFGIPVLVFIFSSLLYYLVNTKTVELGTVNNGELITPPLPFSQLQTRPLSDTELMFDQAESKWSFVVMGDQYCTDNCERMLYIARQSIIALAKKMGRVQLVYVTTDSAISTELAQRIKDEYQGIIVVASERKAIDQLFAAQDLDPLAEQQFFVVDPRGWLMMRYSADNTQQDTLNVLGKAIVRDMKRLIK